MRGMWEFRSWTGTGNNVLLCPAGTGTGTGTTHKYSRRCDVPASCQLLIKGGDSNNDNNNPNESDVMPK